MMDRDSLNQENELQFVDLEFSDKELAGMVKRGLKGIRHKLHKRGTTWVTT